ncbi:MAG: DegT/DnrJ/EryC1/StrS aminotransferase family protein [Nitrospiraceae bacterium]|nr:DegT/DnrJ/EryC1/StrS aminotransferase family protein [Nitrospiraceae bacterium]
MIPVACARLGEEEIDAVVEVLRSGNLRQGMKCSEFEEKFKGAVGAKYATTAANGSVSLQAIYANWIGPGDEVIVPAFTFFATAAMVCHAGGKPVFCDIDPRTFTMDVNDIEDRITRRTRAIAGVHLYGNSCDIDGILEIAGKHGLKVVWDAAQAHLTKYRGKDVGSFGDAVSYSFYATKNMTTGEGGMIASDSPQIIENCILMKQQGQSKKYLHTFLGTNFRMTDVEAAIGIVQLGRLAGFTEKRRENAAFLMKGLEGGDGLVMPYTEPFVEHSYHQFTVLLELEKLKITRDEFAAKLGEAGVGTVVAYPMPLHKQPVFEKILGDQHFPNAEWVAKRCISLPVHPYLSQEDLEKITHEVKNVIESCR